MAHDCPECGELCKCDGSEIIQPPPAVCCCDCHDGGDDPDLEDDLDDFDDEDDGAFEGEEDEP